MSKSLRGLRYVSCLVEDEVGRREELGQTNLMSREGIPWVLSFCSSRSDMFNALGGLISHYRGYHETFVCYEDILQRYKLFVMRP